MRHVAGAFAKYEKRGKISAELEKAGCLNERGRPYKSVRCSAINRRM